MTTPEKILLSDDELDVLSNNDFAEIARKGRIDGEISIEELQGVTSETLVRFKQYLANNNTITGMTSETLVGLKGIVEKVGTSAPQENTDASQPEGAKEKKEEEKVESLPKTLTAPPQSLRDIMYAVKVGYLPITVEDPRFFKDGKLGKLQKGAQWIYVGPSKAAASIQSIIRSIGDETYKKLVAEEMEHVSDELKSLGKKLPKNRKEELEKAIIALKGIDAELLKNTKDGDKAALSLFDEYMRYRGDVQIHNMHTGRNASVEATRLKSELNTIETEILDHNNAIKSRTEAIKVLNEGGHHTLVSGSTTTTPIESLDALSRRYDEAKLAVQEGRAGGSFPRSITELEREHNILIDNAKKLDVINVTSGSITVNMNGATKSSIDAKIATLKADPAYINGAPKNVSGRGGAFTIVPATTEYTAISNVIAQLDGKKDLIDNAVHTAETNKTNVLKPYKDEIHSLDTEKATKVSERTRQIELLERENVAEELKKGKKVTELTEIDTKHKARITKLDEIHKMRDPVIKKRLSKEYDKMVSSPKARSGDETRRQELADGTKTRTDRQTDIGARTAELEREKTFFDKEKSIKRMESIEGKISTLQSEAAKLATDIDAEAAKSGDAETYKRKLFEEVNRINGEIEKLNISGKKEVVNWEKLPKVELDRLLATSKMGNHIYGVSHGLIKIDEKILSQRHIAGSMRGVYGLVALAGVGALGVQAMTDWRSAGWDAADIGLGFIPGYDLYMAFRGKDLNNRKIEGKDLWARIGFGTLALIPAVGALTRTAGVVAMKTAGRVDKTIDVINTVRAVEQSAQVVGKIGSAGYLGYTLFDITKQVATHPIDTVTRKPVKN